MNRIEIISLFTAMKRLHKQNDLEGLGEVIEETLRAAKGEKPKRDKNADKDEE